MALHLAGQIASIREISLDTLMGDSMIMITVIGLVATFLILRKKGPLTIQGAIIITVLFTVLDYFAHVFNILPGLEELPPLYFIFKLIALPAVLIVLVNRFRLKQFVLCTVAALILQTRYFLTTNYDIRTHVIMIVVHYVLILVSIKLAERFSRTRLK